MTNQNIIYAGLYFALSALLTFYFIDGKFWLYESVDDMVMSAGIAGAKWVIQIIAAIIFLRTEKWIFLKRIGFVCFIGSAALYIYYLLPFLPLSLSGFSQFVMSIFFSVIMMSVLYYRAVIKTGISLNWFGLWMFCLTVAIVMQEAFAFKYT